MPTVSVALCTYNGEAFLEAQLESLARQERRPDELVVSDDASNDGTVGLLESFGRRAPFVVRLYRNAERAGVVRNFERALRYCRSDLIALCDQDDVWRADKLARQAELLNRMPDVDLVFSDAAVVGDGLEPYGYRLWEVMGFGGAEQALMQGPDALRVLLRHQVVTGATVMFRASWRQVFLPIPTTWMHDGWIAFLVAASGGIRPMAEPLLLYRQHQRNVIGGRRTGLRQYLARANYERSRETLARDAERFADAGSRLLEHGCALRHPEGQRLMQDAIRHLRRRAGLPHARAKRLGTVAREWVTGRYRRYSGGLLSVAQDLWV